MQNGKQKIQNPTTNVQILPSETNETIHSERTELSSQTTVHLVHLVLMHPKNINVQYEP